MKRNRGSTEEQIIAVLREQEAGVATAELCRKHGVSSATFYKWGRSAAGWKSRTRAAEGAGGGERQLKRLLAEAMLDNAALKDLLGKKW